MRTGFYIASDEMGCDSVAALSSPDALMAVFNTDENFLIDPEWYVHGACDIFALWLSEKYGYDIWAYAIIDPEGTDTLVHAVCVTNVEGKTHWVDVRGMTDDEDEMFCVFENDVNALCSSKPKAYLEVFSFPGTQAGRDEFLEAFPRRSHLLPFFGELDGLVSECRVSPFQVSV